MADPAPTPSAPPPAPAAGNLSGAGSPAAAGAPAVRSPEPPRAGSPWAAPNGEFIMAVHACGCEVKVRNEAAAERMRQVACKRHST